MDLYCSSSLCSVFIAAEGGAAGWRGVRVTPRSVRPGEQRICRLLHQTGTVRQLRSLGQSDSVILCWRWQKSLFSTTDWLLFPLGWYSSGDCTRGTLTVDELDSVQNFLEGRGNYFSEKDFFNLLKKKQMDTFVLYLKLLKEFCNIFKFRFIVHC